MRARWASTTTGAREGMTRSGGPLPRPSLALRLGGRVGTAAVLALALATPGGASAQTSSVPEGPGDGAQSAALIAAGRGSDRTPAEEAATVPLHALVTAMGKVPPGRLSLPTAIKRPRKTSSAVLYVGAGYYPFCAAERWPLVVATGQFGTWSKLRLTTSSKSDVYPSTVTFSFYGAKFTSRYLAFSGVELTSNVPNGKGGYKPLARPTRAEMAVLQRYDKEGSIPFVYLGGHYVLVGASYSPEVLAGMSAKQIAGSLATGKSTAAQQIDASAGYFAADMCQLTDGRPAKVCRALRQAA